MSDTVVPTFSPQGWVSDPGGKADYLMSYFFTTMDNQSTLYSGQISSAQGVMQKGSGDIINTCAAIRDCLEKYLGRYYSSVAVGSTYNLEDDGKYTIGVSIRVTDDSGTYSFTNAIELNGSKIERFTKVNNFGAEQ